MVHDEIIEKLLAHGYIPIPNKGKHWIEKHEGKPILDLKERKIAPDLDLIRAIFAANPGAGISVTSPLIRNSKYKLVLIDIDIYDPELAALIIERVARIIGQPCPFKVGQKGGTFFVVALDEIRLKTQFKNRRNVAATWLTEGKIWGPESVTVGGRKQAVEVICGAGPAHHTVLPPSIHPDTKRPYEWRAFPGTDIIMRLEDTPPDSLPIFTPAMQLLLMLCFQPSLDKIWEFIGATSPGDFHERLRDATFLMHHELFTKEEILELALREARRDSPSNIKQRETEVRNIVDPLATKFPERKPVASGKKRVPPDREQADWVLAQLGYDNCATFNGQPYWWNGQVWQSLGRMAEWYIKIFETFPTANHGSIESALRLAVSSMIIRPPQDSPDLIPFSNGVLHLPTMSLKIEELGDNFVGHLPHPYDPNAVCPAWDMFIRDFLLPPKEAEASPGDHQLAINLFEEYLGYCLIRSHMFQKFLMLIGATGTGKSTLTFVLQGLLPSDWISYVSLEGLAHENLIRTMVNANINISSEAGRLILSGKGIERAILSLTTGEPMTVWTMHRDRTLVSIPARLIINGNIVPKFDSIEGAIQRRILFLRTTDVKPLPVITNFHLHILREAPGIFFKLVTAYKRLIERGEFLPPQYTIREAEDIVRSSNSVSLWFYDGDVEVLDPSERPVQNSELYNAYRGWCEANGHKPFSSNEWGKMLTALGHRSINVRHKIGDKIHILKGRRLITPTAKLRIGEKGDY